MLDFEVEDHIYSQSVSRICGREFSFTLHWDVSLGVQRSVLVAVDHLLPGMDNGKRSFLWYLQSCSGASCERIDISQTYFQRSEKHLLQM